MRFAQEALPRKRRLAMLYRTVRGLLHGPRPVTFPGLTGANLPCMRGRVEILRDANGIPHIYAEHEPDLYAALGYLQGADRFALLDILRHLGAGRMCELIGNFALPKESEMFPGRRVSDLDGFVRPLDFEAQSERDYQSADTRARECLDAFSAGINAALRAMQGVYPPEYALLGPIRPWRPSEALLAARTCAFCVALAPLGVELAFDAVRGHLGDGATRRLYPDAPWEHVPASYQPRDGIEPEPPLHLTGTGSNNWAVSAARSVSGAPIFANDPHVPFLPLPTFWYHAHIECPRYRIQGGLMLGCPIFGFGHNGHLAWGITTAFRDAWDLYRVHRLADDAARYRTVDGQGTITAHREMRKVRFGREVVVQWESCEHGILYPGWKHHDGVDLALRYAPADAGRFFAGYLALAEATTVAGHRAALEQINDGPFDFNHIYAHKGGHIAWEPYGRLPRRRHDGLFVRDAHDPDAQWDGFLPFSENPKIINPERGYVCSANSENDAESFHRLTTRVHVEPPHRHRRIATTLAAHHTHSVETFAAMQRDVGSDYGVPLRDALIALLAPCAGRTDTVGTAYRTLAAWDGRFPAESSAAPLFSLTQRELGPRCFVPLLGQDAGRHYLNTRRGTARLQRLLLDPADPLRGDIERATGASLSSLTQAAFEAAVRNVTEICGPSPAEWVWGKFQRLRLGTLPGEIPLLGRWFRVADAPFPGDVYTVSPAVTVPMRGQMRAFVGATSRFICDLARPEEALFAHTSGPSGDVGSSFYGSLTQPWLRFEYFRSALWKPADVPQVVERLLIPGAAAA